MNNSGIKIKSQQMIICMGEVLIDLLASQADTPWNLVESWESLTGGAPANVAFGLAKMGSHVAFLGSIGNDSAGTSLSQEMQNAGINILSLQKNSEYPTRKVYVERSAMGERFFAGFGNIPVGEFADSHLEASLITEKMFSEVIAIVTGMLLLAFSQSRHAILKALEISYKLNIITVLDVNRRDVFWENPEDYPAAIYPLLPRMKVIKFSIEEATWLMKTTDPSEISRNLPEAEVILVSDGEHGAAWKINGYIGYTKAYKVETIDTTGAGDSFLAGFLYQYLVKCGKPTSEIEAFEIMDFASAMGGLTTTKKGAVNTIPSETEVLEFINSKGKALNEF